MISTTIFLPSQNDTCNEFISRVQCQVQIHISCTLHLREVKCIHKSLTCKVFALVLLEENIFTKWKVHSLVSYYYSTNVILVVSSLYPLSIVIVNPLLYGCSPRDWINFFAPFMRQANISRWVLPTWTNYQSPWQEGTEQSSHLLSGSVV